MARRATYLDELFNEGEPLLLIDAGDLMGKRTKVEREQSRFLCEVTSEFGYDAIGLGESDLNYGVDFLREMIDTYDLPYTSANVFDQAGEPLLPRYLMIERGGVRFGIVSVLGSQYKIISMSARDDALRVDDPVTTLREVLPEMRRAGAETIVLLSHLGDTGTEAVLREVAGVDVCLVGHTHRSYSTPRVFQGSVLLAGSFEGRVVGRLDADIDDQGKVQAFQVQVTSLTTDIAEEPLLVERLQELKQRIEEVRLSVRGRFKPTLGSEKEHFVTNMECRKCHSAIYEQLRKTPHRRTMQTLAAKGQAQNPECLVCHTTGYLYKGGYDDKPPANRLGNVQCEACHGYGSRHARDGKWGAEARESCTFCHDEQNSPDFDYATYWKKIEH